MKHWLDGGGHDLDGLVVEDLTVRFGGVLAVDGLSLASPLGMITGLIGPNGAGKSTTFGACSGFVRPAKGRIRCGGLDVTHLPPSQRAHAGIGRTFQRIELFDSLSVIENVALGLEARLAGSSPLTAVLSRRGQGSAVAAAAREALTRCGLSGIAQERAGVLSTGQRRLVEFARALAGGFRMLLLDEPSSGLDGNEVGHFGDLLRDVVRSDGLGVLIVEHDMSLIAEICDHVYVLDYGRLIFSGTPGEALTSDVVRAAYLGTSPVELSATPAPVGR
ncbi:MAG TPA: ABC transporter ATP-binding protein [Actinomycetota bacterium]|nr:ABC transporter ATP-binding protein [Actinomycetota bacterium]